MFPINHLVYIITSVVCLMRQRAINDAVECLSAVDIHLRISRVGNQVLRPHAARRRDSQYESPLQPSFQNGGINNNNPNKEIIK